MEEKTTRSSTPRKSQPQAPRGLREEIKNCTQGLIPRKPYKKPRLYDKKGDLSKRWYVRYFLLKPDGTFFERREYIPMKLRTAEDRYRAGRDILEIVDTFLMNGKLTYEHLYGTEKIQKQPKFKGSFLHAMEEALDIIKEDSTNRTYLSYKSAYKKFSTFLIKEGLHKLPPTHVEKSLIYKFLHSDNTIKNRTKNKVKDFLSAICQRAIEMELINQNPFAGIKKLKEEQKRIGVWDPDDLEKYFDYCKNEDLDLYTASLLLFHCFMRPTEIGRIQVKDLLLKDGIVLVRVKKGALERKDPASLSDELKDLLKERSKGLHLEDYLFSGSSLKPGKSGTSTNRLGERFDRVKRKLQFNRTESVFYELKHTGVSIASASGVPTYNIQRQCRHHSLSTTEIYLRRLSSKGDQHFSNFPSMKAIKLLYSY